MRSMPLSKVAPAIASGVIPTADEIVWHLTLDQIVSGTGRIENCVYAPLSEAGGSTFFFDKGNVLYSKLRPYLNKVVCPDSFGVATTELVPLRPDPDELNREYLCYYLRSSKFVSWVSSQVAGAKMPRVNMKAFWSHEIPLPSLADQTRIAHLLSKVEGLIAQRKQHLQQLDDLLKSVFLEMFGDPVRNEKGWEETSLRSGCKEIYRYPTFYGFEYSKEGIPVVRIGNILSNGNIDPDLEHYVYIPTEISKKYPRTILEFNDILMAVRGDGSTGKRIGIVNSSNLVGANISPNLLRFSCNKNIFNPLYFFHFLTSERGQVLVTRNITRTAKKTITAENLKITMIPCPPVKLQNYFASSVEKVESLKSKYQETLSELENLYGVLSQKAFKGELDLSRVFLPVDQAEAVEEMKPFVPVTIEKEPKPAIELPAPDDAGLFNVIAEGGAEP